MTRAELQMRRFEQRHMHEQRLLTGDGLTPLHRRRLRILAVRRNMRSLWLGLARADDGVRMLHEWALKFHETMMELREQQWKEGLHGLPERPQILCRPPG